MIANNNTPVKTDQSEMFPFTNERRNILLLLQVNSFDLSIKLFSAVPMLKEVSHEN